MDELLERFWEEKTTKIMKEGEEFHRSVNTTEDSLWTARYRTINEREAPHRAYISDISFMPDSKD